MMVLDSGFRELADRSLQQLLDSQMSRSSLRRTERMEIRAGSTDLAPSATPRSGLYAQSSHQKQSRVAARIDGGFIHRLRAAREPASAISATHPTARADSKSKAAVSSSRTAPVTIELTFSVAASLTPYEQQLWAFRRQLFGWFSGLMLLLRQRSPVCALVLSPVRRIEREIQRWQEGRSDAWARLSRELSGVGHHLIHC